MSGRGRRTITAVRVQAREAGHGTVWVSPEQFCRRGPGATGTTLSGRALGQALLARTGEPLAADPLFHRCARCARAHAPVPPHAVLAHPVRPVSSRATARQQP